MKKKLIFFVQAICFLAILAAVFSPLRQLMARKSLVGVWNMTEKVGGFYNEPQNEFDLMFFGSSHIYASIAPMRLWEDTGVKSYVFATQQQPAWATYTYLKEALKSQSPRLVVVECQMLLHDEDYYEEGVTYSYMDDLRFSWDKVQLAWHSAPTMEERVELLCNYIKYHVRWSELTKEDYAFDPKALRDPLKGYVQLWDTPDPQPRPNIDEITGRAALTEKNERWLREIIALCQERGIELWLIKAPSNLLEEEKLRLNTIGDTAAEYGVMFHDFNEDYAAVGLTPDRFYDAHHLDAWGAAAFTDYFAEYLTERYDLPRHPDDPQWKLDTAVYDEALQKDE